MNLNIEDISIFTSIIKFFSMQIFTFVIYLKTTNTKIQHKAYIIYYAVLLLLNSIAVAIIKDKAGYLVSITFLIVFLSFICSGISKQTIMNTVFTIVFCLSISYIMSFIGIIFTYLINSVFVIKSDLINLLIMIVMQAILTKYFIGIKRIKNGISIFKLNIKDELLDIIILNYSAIIYFLFVFFSKMDIKQKLSKQLGISFILLSIIMIYTIKKSIELHYKQKLLIQDLNETKKELEEKEKEIEELEAENLSFSKKSHSLAHKQKSLEFKINKLLMNSESAEELGLQEELKDITGQLQENLNLPKLDKTGITEIDDMLEVMQEECRINEIDFNLQINGNIYQMTNNYVTKEELAILLADHIKDAIIAINHTDNINKSIMLRLGKNDDCFGIYIYDSGVEFSKEIFEKLGKKPITSYANEGGTGMGFMNTFDTLKKHNASLIIENIGKPSKDNYTKVIKIKFDNKNMVSFN